MNSFLTISISMLLSAGISLGASHVVHQQKLSDLTFTLSSKEREIARLERRLSRMQQAAVKPRAFAPGQRKALSLAAFEVPLSPSQPPASARPVAASDTTVAALLEEKKALLDALDAAQKKLNKKREKSPALRIHYYRADRDYFGWGVHTKGNAVTTRTAWSSPIKFKYLSEFGAYAVVKLHDEYKQYPLEFLVHNGPDIDADPSPRVAYTDASKAYLQVDANETKTVYLVSGVNRVFLTKDQAMDAIAQQRSATHAGRDI